MAQHFLEKCFDADIDANNNLFLIGSVITIIHLVKKRVLKINPQRNFISK